jgi:PII-like signaling protein
MPITQPASLLRIHVCEGDKYGDKILYEAIVDKCLELGLAGASVFQGVAGYGETAEIHRKRLLAKDQPIVIVVVDSEEKIRGALPVIEGMVDTGMIATSPVEMTRIQSGS